MFALGPVGFAAPWLLVGLVALPILWLILRAVPPAPIRRRFPGVALLLGLTDDAAQTDRTPWWLLLLRCLAVGAVIAGFAGPVLNPEPGERGAGPLLILADGTWADARDWEARVDRIAALVDQAGRDGRPVAVRVLTAPTPVEFVNAETAALALPSLRPNPWEPVLAPDLGRLPGGMETVWLSDGLDRPGRGDLAAALLAAGPLTVVQAPRPTFALRPARLVDGVLTLSAVRSPTGPAQTVTVNAMGPDPAGVERVLGTAPLVFQPGDALAEVVLDLPAELRARIARFELAGQRSAAAISLTDDALKRREIALVSGAAEAETLDLLSPLHYLRQALRVDASLIEGALADALPSNPDVVILADVPRLTESEAGALTDWVEAGGILVRFAGPRLAGAVEPGAVDPLLPVRLRAGGRSVGGAMSWGEPKSLAPFADTSPFFGLTIPDDLGITAQVMAEPDPALADRVIAQLTDGTPLVTRAVMGQGQVVLFHVTANAEWSNLPLSGLFVQMLGRLSVAGRPTGALEGDLAGTTWVPEVVMDAWGGLEETDTLPGVPGERIATGLPGADLPPGLYAGADRRLAVNVAGAGTVLAPAAWSDGAVVTGLTQAVARDLAGWLLSFAVLALAIDVLASLFLSGRLGSRLATVLALFMVPVPDARADDTLALAATGEVVLAYVVTGDARVDDVSRAGLLGLSRTLFQRTAIEPGDPIAIDIERDELTFFPFIYWPVTADAAAPSADAAARLNRYLQSGGMILFDTRDADLGGFGDGTPEGRRLQAIALGLDIPALEPVPQDHVLTRTFYLLQDFPGRFAGREIWVEAAPPGAELADGMPFRNLNDGVTPVVIGGNDWAAAWAVDDLGAPMFPVGRGLAGERQREMALRFGVNLIMHVLTGNYKSDQVHVPALLDRLGQ